MNKFFSKIGIIFVLALVLAFGMIYAYKIIKEPKSNVIIKNDNSFNPIKEKINIYDTVINEIKQQNSMIVLEVEAEQPIEVSKAFWNLEVFKKSKNIMFYGIGQFTVNLSTVTSESIDIDDDTKIVNISINKPILENVFIDEEKTDFKETEKGMLAFGDYKITFEQYNDIVVEAKEKITNQINSELTFERAKSSAAANIVSLIKSVLLNSDYSDYNIKINFNEPE